MPEILLTLNNVDELLREFEERHGFTTEEFRRNPEHRTDLSEDVVFQWEALIDHRRALREIQAELHQQYLSRLRHGVVEDGDTDTRQTMLAA